MHIYSTLWPLGATKAPVRTTHMLDEYTGEKARERKREEREREKGTHMSFETVSEAEGSRSESHPSCGQIHTERALS